jgi:hypothetical protein
MDLVLNSLKFKDFRRNIGTQYRRREKKKRMVMAEGKKTSAIFYLVVFFLNIFYLKVY